MAHPIYGERYICFSCGVKFYDLRKEEPLCPKCGVDQRRAPKKKPPKSTKSASVKVYDQEEKGIDDIDSPGPSNDEIENLELETAGDASFDDDDIEGEEY